MNQCTQTRVLAVKRARSGGNLELDRGAVGGEHLRDPEIGADGRAGVLDRLDLRGAAREASGKVDDVREVAALRAMDGDSITHVVATLRPSMRMPRRNRAHAIVITGCRAARILLRSAHRSGRKPSPVIRGTFFLGGRREGTESRRSA